MIKKKVVSKSLFVVSLLFISHQQAGGSIIPVIERITGQQVWDPVKHFSVGQEKEQLLHDVAQELSELEDQDSLFTTQNEAQLAEVQTELAAAKSKSDRYLDDELIAKELSILNDTYQVLKDTFRIKDQLKTLLVKFSKTLDRFFQDPEMSHYKKEHRLIDRAYYSFQDLEKIHEKILEQTRLINHLVEQEKNVKTELENHKRLVATTQEEYKKIQEKLVVENLSPLAQFSRENIFGQHNDKALLILEERLYSIKKENHALQSKELKRRMELCAFQLFMAKAELDLLKQYLQKIKPSVRVTEADIVHERDELAKWKLNYYKKRDEFRHIVEQLSEELKQKEQAVSLLSKKYSIPISSELTKWTKDPVKNVKGYSSLITLSHLNTELLLLEYEKELNEAQIAFEDDLLTYKTTQIQVEESYQKISSRKLSSDEELNKEIRFYETILSDAKTKETKYKEKINQTNELISTKKLTIDAINALKNQLHKMQETVFKNSALEYQQCTDLLKESEGLIHKQLEILSNLTGIYSGILLHNTNTQRLIFFIKGELETITIWRRSERAINWQGLADILLFVSDMVTYVGHFNAKSFVSHVADALPSIVAMIILLIKLLLVIALLLIVQKNISTVIARLLFTTHHHSGAIAYGAMILTCLCSFIQAHFLSIAGWLVALFLGNALFVTDKYPLALFLLFSIPYLILLARNLLLFIVQFNALHNYYLFAKIFKNRLITVCAVILYTTIAITCFRQAFMLVSYYKSELPTILLAINSIIVSLSPIFLVSREQIVSYVSSEDRLGRWLKIKINTNYYLLMIIVGAIIIMINPYVGFGHLVSHILFNVLYTCALIFMLLWVYTTFKGLVSRVFFFTEQEVTRERFSNAKVWFGLIIICSFILTVFIGIIVASRLWGWHIHLSDMIALLREPLINKGTTNPITIVSLLQIMIFIFAGFMISYAINSIVLDKIFDLLLIDAGVQYAVTRITQYIVITITIFIGFHSVGLGQMIVLMLGGLALSLGWVLKEPVSDFAAYFMILIQRPIKIGDYIELNEEIKGVVRKITPRSVLLRKKNSTMVVVPNSIITTKPINNWNYTRNFTAFNDITLVIPYKEDPVLVKRLLHKAVDSHPNVLKNPPSVVRLENFGENGYEFMIRGHINPVYTLEQWNIASDVRLAMVRLLREHNIQIAMPIRIVHNEATMGQNNGTKRSGQGPITPE